MAGAGLLALPTVLLGLDVTVLYLVVPNLMDDLAPSRTQVLWIMDVYGFFIAGFLITMGTLGTGSGGVVCSSSARWRSRPCP